VKDFAAGRRSHSLSGLYAVGGMVYFSYVDPSGNGSWWQSDGTAAGTVPNPNPPIGTGDPGFNPLTAPDGLTFSTAPDPAGNYEVDLTATHGTTGVTTVLHVYPGLVGGNGILPQPVNHLTLVGNTLFFGAYDPTF